MNESGSLYEMMKELTAEACDSWGYHLNPHKRSKNLEGGEAQRWPSFYCRPRAKLWKLTQEIYGATSADQGHLELKGSEWLDLSDPLMTHKIVLPWYDKTSEHTTLKRLGMGEPGQSRAWICTGHVNKQLETGLPTVSQPRGPGDSQNLRTKAFPEVHF